jgi:photosystem II stability/assembly factor-like uncharacterized protein
MVARYCSLLLVFLCLSPDGYSQSQEDWNWVAPYPPRLGGYSASVAGDRAYFWCAENLVLGVFQGGDSFKVSQYAPSADVSNGSVGHGLAFADSLTGYVTDLSAGEFRTTDGGAHWTKVGNIGANIELVEFGSSSVGWKVGIGGAYRTSDAGLSWSPMAPLYDKPGIFSNIFALDENSLWVLKSFNAEPRPGGAIWYSNTSGSLWTKLNLGNIADTNSQVYLTSIRVNPSGIGFVLGRAYHGSTRTSDAFILRTVDFGATWSQTPRPDEFLKEIISLDDETWILLGNKQGYEPNGSLQLKTTDKGQSWELTKPLSGMYDRVGSAVYLESRGRIIVSTSGGIYVSDDRGQTYNRLTSERDIYVADMTMDRQPASTESQWILAKSNSDRTFLLSTDAGRNWQPKVFPGSTSLGYGDARITDGSIFVIVNEYALYQSIDTGATWGRIDLQGYAARRALAVDGNQRLSFQGDAELLSTTNGGEEWLRGPLPRAYRLNETAILSPGHVVAVGEYYDTTGTRGLIYHTSDFGYEWRIEDRPTEMDQLGWINDTLLYALGTRGLYKSVNDGASWSISYSTPPYYNGLTAFCFENPSHGLIRSAFFTYETSDGGITWNRLNLAIPIQYRINRLAYSVRGELFVVGNGRLVHQSLEGTDVSPILLQNHPNPFNPTTTISFSLSKSELVKITLYDFLGRFITTIVDGEYGLGDHSIGFDGSSLASGVYFIRLYTQTNLATRKMLLIR